VNPFHFVEDTYKNVIRGLKVKLLANKRHGSLKIKLFLRCCFNSFLLHDAIIGMLFNKPYYLNIPCLVCNAELVRECEVELKKFRHPEREEK